MWTPEWTLVVDHGRIVSGAAGAPYGGPKVETSFSDLLFLILSKKGELFY